MKIASAATAHVAAIRAHFLHRSAALATIPKSRIASVPALTPEGRLVVTETEGTGPSLANTFPELESRFRRFKSARISAALWQRTSRSFSRALLIIRSNSDGISGFTLLGGAGVLFRIASKIAADVSPRKGSTPVALSYRSAPKENKSLRA